jgi:hypothetical protein
MGSGDSSRCAALAVVLLGAAACSHEWEAYDPSEPTASPSTASGSGAAASSGTHGAGAASSGGSTASGSGATAGGGGGAGNSGAGGGAGGGSPVECNGTSVLADDFASAAATAGKFQMPTGTSVAAGEAIAKLPTGGQSSWVGLSSKRFYDLRGDGVAAEISQMVNTATSAYGFLEVVYNGDNYISVFQQNGQIAFVKYIDQTWVEIASTIYDPDLHRFWRIREDGAGTTLWETSANGSTWIAAADWSTAELFPMDLVVVELGAGTEGGEVAPGEIRFEGLSGMNPGEGHCPSSSLTDDFGDPARARAWESAWADVGCTLAEAGGELVVTLADTEVAYCAYQTAAAFDLGGDTITVQVPSMVDTSTSAQGYVAIQGRSGAQLQFVQGSGQLDFREVFAATYTTLASVLYSPANHLWWRFREEAGTIYWETSGDGIDWTIRAQEAASYLDASAVTVVLGGGTWEPQATPGAVHYDRYNLP